MFPTRFTDALSSLYARYVYVPVTVHCVYICIVHKFMKKCAFMFAYLMYVYYSEKKQAMCGSAQTTSKKEEHTLLNINHVLKHYFSLKCL